MNKIVYSQQTMFLHRTRYKNDFLLIASAQRTSCTNTQKKQGYFVYPPNYSLSLLLIQLVVHDRDQLLPRP